MEDNLGADCREWARARKQPILLVETDCQVGLTSEQVEELISFAQQASTEADEAHGSDG